MKAIPPKTKRQSTFQQDMMLFRRMGTYLAPYKSRIFWGMLASIPVSAFDAATAWVVGPFVDFILKAKDSQFLFYIPLLIVGGSFLQGVFEYLSQYLTSYVGLSVSQTLRKELFQKLSRMEFLYFKNHNSGELLTRYFSDPGNLQQTLVANVQGVVINFFSMLFLAGVLFYRNWQFALIAIGIISFIILPIQAISKKVRHLDHVAQKIMSRLVGIFYEFVHGVDILRVFNLVPHHVQRFDKALDELFSANIRTIKANILLRPIMQAIGSVGLSIIVMLGCYNMIHGAMTPGELISFALALLLLYRPVKNLGGFISRMQQILAPIERVFNKMDQVPALQEGTTPKTVDHFETLVFEHVSFEYKPEERVLKNINLTVKAGDTVALVGGSGGGKSTFVQMIPRFFDPLEGRIRLNGIDLRELSFWSLSSLIALVSQNTILFDGTIRENIRLGRPGASDTDVQKAVRDAYLEDWIHTLPLGLDTPVGEQGMLLSGGQRQRVAIARAYLKDAPILILDEATSALDNETEAMVQMALTELQKNRTVFVIAHRLSTVQFADRILVMDKGQIVESGTHLDLLAQEGIYNKLYSLQFRHQETAAVASPSKFPA